MNSPKVTVLMSVWNGAPFLRESIQSVLGQSFTDFELNIIDDGSTDPTSDVLHSFNDSRIRIIKNEIHLGLTKSLNIGLNQSKGEYVARMDGDDLSHPKRLEKQVKFLDENKSFKLVGSWTEIIDGQGKTVNSWKVNFSPEEIYYILHFRNCLTHSAVMFDKEFSLKLKGYNENINQAQDYEFWTRFNKKTKIMQLEEILIKRRETGSNISTQFREAQKETVRKTMESTITRLTGRQIKKEFLTMMGDDLTPIKTLSQSEKTEFIQCLDLVHNSLLSDRKNFVDKENFIKVLEKRKRYFLDHLFPEKMRIQKPIFINKISKFIHRRKTFYE